MTPSHIGMSLKNFQEMSRIALLDKSQKKPYSLFMPTVKVSAQSKFSPQECFSKVSQLLEKDPELRKLDPKYNCQFDAQKCTGTAEGKQFKAQMKVEAQGPGSQVEISIEIPFHLALAKGLIQKTLEKKLATALG